jgi:hypothetical protein
MSTRVAPMARLSFFVPQHPCNELLLLYFRASPGSADYGTNVRPTAGYSIFSFRSKYSIYNKGIKTGILSSWRVTLF